MADDINQVTLCGSLGEDPDLRVGQSGTAMCKLRIATNKQVKKRGSEVYEKVSEWHTAVVFGKRGEFAAADLSKGDRVTVLGELSTRSYTDRDGQKKYTTEIVASSVCYSRRGEGGQRQAQKEAPAEPLGGDDIPF